MDSLLEQMHFSCDSNRQIPQGAVDTDVTGKLFVELSYNAITSVSVAVHFS